MQRLRRTATACLALAIALAASHPASAGDYTITDGGDLYESPPQQGATNTGATTGVYGSVSVDLPFLFPYYGRGFRTVLVSPFGLVVPGQQEGVTINSPSGHQSVPLDWADNADGAIAIFWDWIYVGDESRAIGDVVTWTTGTAPRREFVISWEKSLFNYNYNNPQYFQIRLGEDGTIVLAYRPGSWDTDSFYVPGYKRCIDAPGDDRHQPLTGANTVHQTSPDTSFVFTPDLVPYSGSVTFDRPTTDADAFGGDVDEDAPLAGFDVELRRGGGLGTSAVTRTAGDGSFVLNGVALPDDESGSIVLVARTDVATVMDSAGDPEFVALDGSVEFDSPESLGVISFDGTNDASGAQRAPFRVLQAVSAARAWADANLPDADIPHLDVRVGSTPTGYVLTGPGGPGVLVVGGPGAQNPDHADEDEIIRSFGLHVLAQITVPQNSGPQRFDEESSPESAFAHGFAYWFLARMRGDATYLNGDTSGVVERDLETPQLPESGGSPAMTAAVAGMLYDVLDAANETHDTIDGTTSPDRVVTLVGEIEGDVTAASFFDAWESAGHDAAALARSYIAHGLRPDDVHEPNDHSEEATAMGPGGARLSNLKIDHANEDWFRFDLPGTAATLRVDVEIDTVGTSARLGLEVYGPDGGLLHEGVVSRPFGDQNLSFSPAPAGHYTVRVTHLDGPPVDAYTLQLYEPLDLEDALIPEWTVGELLVYDLPGRGGIEPLDFRIGPGDKLAAGLGFDQPGRRLVGTPTEAVVREIELVLVDDGSPQNVVTRRLTHRVNPPLDLALPEFLPVAHGRQTDLRRALLGGTPPYAFSVSGGSLPSGLSQAAGELRWTGTATVAGSVFAEVAGVDRAGSDMTSDVTFVVCVAGVEKKAAATLATGDAACGWFVDVLRGGSLKASVKTAKKGVKRGLRAVVVGPDGESLDATVKAKRGKASVRATAATSGRHYIVLAAESGDETVLELTAKVKASKRGAANFADVGQGTLLQVPFGALAGAKLSAAAKTSKKSGITLRIVGLIDPDGRSLPIDALVKGSDRSQKLKATLDRDGTWTLVVSGTSGSAGDVKVRYSVKQPKGRSYDADD